VAKLGQYLALRPLGGKLRRSTGGTFVGYSSAVVRPRMTTVKRTT
jgi:hypothetical protein